MTWPYRREPYGHQVHGINALIKLDDPATGRVFPGCFALFDEMGAGKTKQTIDAAQILFRMGHIDRVLVLAPASVRTVWTDPELGELARHLWEDMPARVLEYHNKVREWATPVEGPQLEWLITNYEYVRTSEARLLKLASYANSRTMLVLDESSAVKNHKAKQTKACMLLRKRVSRVVLLNGTPIANNPLDMYAQGQLMDPRILDCRSYFHFRAKYAILGGWQAKQIVGWQNLEDMQKRFAPYVLRRLKKDCLDLPEKLPSVVLTCELTPSTWAVYREMRDQMVAWLDKQTASVAPQAVVKALRLAQLTSGFLGGLRADLQIATDPNRPAWLDDHEVDLQDTQDLADDSLIVQNCASSTVSPLEPAYLPPREVSREKLDLFLSWLADQLEEEPNFKMLLWCRFRPELQRLLNELSRMKVEVGAIWGSQKREEREHALRLLDPRTSPNKPIVVVGTPATGSMGLNLTAANNVMYISNDYSLKVRLQSEDRVHRPGQVRNVSYFDVVARGPQGQKTVDHAILKALREKDDVARWTTSAWMKALTDE